MKDKTLDPNKGWFYSVSSSPLNKSFILSLRYDGELKHKESFTYHPGEKTIEKIKKEIQNGEKTRKNKKNTKEEKEDFWGE